MTDLVKRLRALVILDEVGSRNSLGEEAADEIERLQAAGEAMREAMEKIAWPEDHSKSTHDGDSEIASAAIASPAGWPDCFVQAAAMLWIVTQDNDQTLAKLARRTFDALPASLREAARHE